MIDQLFVNLPDLQNLATDILGHARTQGATSAQVTVRENRGLSARARMGDVETLEYHQGRGANVTLYFGQRKGSASSSDFSAGALKETVAAAVAIARYTAEDEYAGLADAERMAEDVADLDLDHPWELAPEDAISLAIECENTGRAADARIVNSEGASVASWRTARVYANTHGFVGAYQSTRHSISCSVVGELDGGMQRDYWYSAARNQRELETPQRVGEVAAQRTLRRLGAERISTRTAPVIFAAEVARGLLGHFSAAIAGPALYRKSSFLLDHLGKQVFPHGVRIHEQPRLKAQLGSAPFDKEGVATQARDLVTDGVLQGYALGSYSGRRLGMETTGNAGGLRNLTIDPGARDFAGLLKLMDRGLVVTELIGHGVNMVTGDYSRGAAGFWVEHGETQFPVEEITIAGNLKDMFMSVVEFGNDVDIRGNIRCGSILIDQMTIAGE